MNYVIVVPHYNHQQRFRDFLPRLLATGLPLIVVDDGSDAEQFHALEQVTRDQASVRLLRHERNKGKGAAVKSGLREAHELHYSHAIQIDADGQHEPGDIQRFIEMSQQHPGAIICGLPVFDASIPRVRLYGRRFADFWTMLETLSLSIKDSLCGFRLYPLDPTTALLRGQTTGDRMEFDPEVLVRAHWAGIPLLYIPTAVTYPLDSTSHFHYLADNTIIVRRHARLVLGMLLRSPRLMARLLRRQLASGKTAGRKRET